MSTSSPPPPEEKPAPSDGEAPAKKSSRPPPSDPGPRGAESVISMTRRSLVGIRSGSSVGSAWAALANGLLITSHEAVGMAPIVDIDMGGDQHMGGRVIWVDVAHDLAAVLPMEKLPLPPLHIRPDLPRTGETVYLVSFASGQPIRVTSALVSAVDIRFGKVRCFEIDGPPPPSGAVVVDIGAQVVGVAGLDVPRGARRGHKQKHPRELAFPAVTLANAVASFDRERGGPLEARTPVYHCPACNEAFGADQERCLACGDLLPHTWHAGRSISLGQKLVRELFSSMGMSSVNARVGPRRWRMLAPAAAETGPRSTQPMIRRSIEILFEVDEHDRLLRMRTPLVRIPRQNRDSFFRFLLTLNDQTATSFRISITDGIAELSFVEPVEGLRASDAVVLFREIVRLGEHYRKVLAEPFEAEPIMST